MESGFINNIFNLKLTGGLITYILELYCAYPVLRSRCCFFLNQSHIKCQCYLVCIRDHGLNFGLSQTNRTTKCKFYSIYTRDHDLDISLIWTNHTAKCLFYPMHIGITALTLVSLGPTTYKSTVDFGLNNRYRQRSLRLCNLTLTNVFHSTIQFPCTLIILLTYIITNQVRFGYRLYYARLISW